MQARGDAHPLQAFVLDELFADVLKHGHRVEGPLDAPLPGFG
jgi:hypothetical protein